MRASAGAFGSVPRAGLAAVLMALVPALAAAEGTIVLTPDPLNMMASDIGELTITLSEPAPPTGLVVFLTSASGLVTVDQAVVLAGETSARAKVAAGDVPGTDVVTATAEGFASASAGVVLAQNPNPCRTRAQQAIRAAYAYARAARRVPGACRPSSKTCILVLHTAETALEAVQAANDAMPPVCLVKKVVGER